MGGAMHSRWTKAITVMVLLAVVYVLASPVFVLDPSANRAWLAALRLMSSIALLAFVLCGFQSPMVVLAWISPVHESRGSPDLNLLTCVSLC